MSCVFSPGLLLGDGDVTDPIWRLIGQFDHITIGQ